MAPRYSSNVSPGCSFRASNLCSTSSCGSRVIHLFLKSALRVSHTSLSAALTSVRIQVSAGPSKCRARWVPASLSFHLHVVLSNSNLDRKSSAFPRPLNDANLYFMLFAILAVSGSVFTSNSSSPSCVESESEPDICYAQLVNLLSYLSSQNTIKYNKSSQNTIKYNKSKWYSRIGFSASPPAVLGVFLEVRLCWGCSR